MYTIGQFSRICQVSPKALRHYEKIGLLAPARVDDYNQYRYYSDEQVNAVKAIMFLKDLGIPLKTIKEIIQKGSQPEEISAELEAHRGALLKQLEILDHRLVRLARWRNSMEAISMGETKKYDVRLRDMQETPVFSKRKVMKDVHRELPQLMLDLTEELAAKGGICAGAPMIMYYDDFSAEGFNPQKVDAEAAWPVVDKSLVTSTLPAVRAASCMYVGPYDGLEQAYGAVFTWINENGYQMLFPTREIYHNDPATTPPDQLITEILIPIALIK